MLIKKPHIGTRLGLGDVDPVQPLNLEHPLMRGVQGFWLPLPQLSGGSRFYDISRYGRHGIFTEMDAATSWVRDAEVLSPVVRTDSTIDGQKVRLPQFQATEAITLWAYVKSFEWEPPGNNNGDESQLFFVGDDSPQLELFSRGGQLWFIYWDGSNATGLDNATPAPSVDEWHLISASFGGSSLFELYVDGALKASVNDPVSVAYSGTANTYANHISENRTFEGVTAAFGISDERYSEQMHAQLYEQARRGFPDLLNRRPSMTVVDMASVGEVIQITVTDNITTSDNTEGRAKASASAPSGITLDSLVNAVATAREIAVDTMTVDELIPASARAGGSVEEQTAATDVKFGLIDEFLSFLIENGLISEETLADISAVSATEEGVTLVDITNARSILFEEIAELTETNDAAVAVMKSLGLTREDVLFGDEIIPSIADVIIAALQSTFFTETRALGTAEMLDVIASSAALEDTVISKVISVVGNVIEENATFGAITSARMIAVIRSLEDVTLSEIVEARSLTRGFIGETLAFDDVIQFRLIDKLWVTAKISVEPKILTESIDIKPKR